MQLEGLVERSIAVSYPNVVWGGVPAEIEFRAFCTKNLTSGGNSFNYDFHFPEN